MDVFALFNLLIILVAFFGPLFLIPSTFKFAGGIFAKIVGGVESLGKLANKQSGGWLDKKKGRTEWARKRQERERAADTLSRQRYGQSMAGQQARGRSSRLGRYLTYGTLDKGVADIMEGNAQKAASDAAGEEARAQYDAAFKGLNDTREDQYRVATGGIGSSVTLTNGKSVTITPEMLGYNYQKSLDSNNYAALGALENRAKSDPEIASVLSNLKQGDFGGVAAKRPQTAKGPITVGPGGVSPAVKGAIDGYDSLSNGEDLKLSDGSKVPTDNDQAAVRQVIKTLAGGSPSEHSQAAGYLTSILQNPKVKDEAIKIVGEEFGISNPQAVQTSGGSLRVDPASPGEFKIVPSSSVPGSGQQPPAPPASSGPDMSPSGTPRNPNNGYM